MILSVQKAKELLNMDQQSYEHNSNEIFEQKWKCTNLRQRPTRTQFSFSNFCTWILNTYSDIFETVEVSPVCSNLFSFVVIYFEDLPSDTSHSFPPLTPVQCVDENYGNEIGLARPYTYIRIRDGSYVHTYILLPPYKRLWLLMVTVHSIGCIGMRVCIRWSVWGGW